MSLPLAIGKEQIRIFQQEYVPANKSEGFSISDKSFIHHIVGLATKKAFAFASIVTRYNSDDLNHQRSIHLEKTLHSIDINHQNLSQPFPMVSNDVKGVEIAYNLAISYFGTTCWIFDAFSDSMDDASYNNACNNDYLFFLESLKNTILSGISHSKDQTVRIDIPRQGLRVRLTSDDGVVSSSHVSFEELHYISQLCYQLNIWSRKLYELLDISFDDRIYQSCFRSLVNDCLTIEKDALDRHSPRHRMIYNNLSSYIPYRHRTAGGIQMFFYFNVPLFRAYDRLHQGHIHDRMISFFNDRYHPDNEYIVDLLYIVMSTSTWMRNDLVSYKKDLVEDTPSLMTVLIRNHQEKSSSNTHEDCVNQSILTGLEIIRRWSTISSDILKSYSRRHNIDAKDSLDYKHQEFIQFYILLTLRFSLIWNDLHTIAYASQTKSYLMDLSMIDSKVIEKYKTSQQEWDVKELFGIVDQIA